MALSMIEEAERRGDLQPGMTVVEYTGGSTGSSLAFVCAAKGYRFRVVSSDAFAAEKLATMRAFGAELTIIESDGGKVTPDLIPKMMQKASEYAAEPDTYWTNQTPTTVIRWSGTEKSDGASGADSPTDRRVLRRSRYRRFGHGCVGRTQERRVGREGRDLRASIDTSDLRW